MNCSGPLNLISEKREERRPWTESSIRKPLKRAEEELAMRRVIEDEPIVLAPNWAWESGQDRKAVDEGVDVADTLAPKEEISIS